MTRSYGNRSSEPTQKKDEQPAINYKHSWVIDGMDCPSCVNKLQTALESTKEIHWATVSFTTKKLQVTYAEDVSLSEGEALVSRVVNQFGFSLHSPDSTKKAKYSSTYTINTIVYWAGIFIFLLAAIVFWHTHSILSHLSFSSATLWGLFPVAKKAWFQAHRGIFFGIETLMAVACIGALFLGDYFEAALVLVLFRFGEYLESLAAGKARKGVESLMKLTPNTAILIKDTVKVEVAARSLKPGDTIELRPGDCLPVDGELLENASLDQSALTGESLPVDKVVGEQVMAGILVVGTRTTVKVTSEPGNNAIDRILHLIEEADSHKAPVEKFIDRFSRRYTPIMLLLALFTIFVPPLFFAGVWDTWIYRGLALLLIACPCALVISTPAAITSALTSASKMGALIKGGAALEGLSRVSHITFDKTGTLTKGLLKVSDVCSLSKDTDWLSLAASIERDSNHPLAKAFVAEARSKQMTIAQAKSVQVMLGKGVIGEVNGKQVVVASPSYLKQLIQSEDKNKAADWVCTKESEGSTVVGVCIDAELQGLVAFTDSLREDAVVSVNQLRMMGIKSTILTGDNSRAVDFMSRQLAVDYKAELLPEDKVKAIISLKEQGRVAMVGDGINDGPALKVADVGIAMGKGSDTALEVADAALTHERLKHLVSMIKLSKRTVSIIRQNIGWALGIKLVVLSTTLFGVTGLMVAVLADTGATAAVTLNSLRLLKKPD